MLIGNVMSHNKGLTMLDSRGDLLGLFIIARCLVQQSLIACLFVTEASSHRFVESNTSKQAMFTQPRPSKSGEHALAWLSMKYSTRFVSCCSPNNAITLYAFSKCSNRTLSLFSFWNCKYSKCVLQLFAHFIFGIHLPRAEGGELQKILEEDECIPENVCRQLMRQIVEAVQHLHSHNIVHLDIKVNWT